MTPSAPPTPDRRSALMAALVLFGVIAALLVLVLVFAPSSSPSKDVPGNRDEPTGIIPRPDQGRAPQSPGDRGGWEQLATFAAIIGALGLLVALAWRSSRRARTQPPTSEPPEAERSP